MLSQAAAETREEETSQHRAQANNHPRSPPGLPWKNKELSFKTGKTDLQMDGA